MMLIDKNEHFRLQSTPCANVWTGTKGSNRITLINRLNGKKFKSLVNLSVINVSCQLLMLLSECFGLSVCFCS